YTAVSIGRSSLSRPLQIVLVDTGREEMTRHSRLGLEIAAGARVEIVETRIALPRGQPSGANHWRNHLFELRIGAGAELRSYHEFGAAAGLHPFETHGLIARMEAKADWRATKLLRANPTMDSGYGFIRHDLRLLLAGEEANFALDAVILSEVAHKVILATQIQHLVPNCDSQQAIKIVARDESDAVMQGLILVHPDAQKTEAHLLARGMIFAPEPEPRARAQIHLKPELKIFADDVKCSHGATVGEMDREALFYLTSRGLPLVVAREILSAAFISSALDSLEAFSEPAIAAAAQKLLLGGAIHD
ncbi:MAG: SufD family Fe-S cluster assembly protein, partial [Alphaproteobacteria bacterium]|nr:SufD family Fe-S cluster assembly protein [Alphaproteobacteria bacterium]